MEPSWITVQQPYSRCGIGHLEWGACRIGNRRGHTKTKHSGQPRQVKNISARFPGASRLVFADREVIRLRVKPLFSANPPQLGETSFRRGRAGGVGQDQACQLRQQREACRLLLPPWQGVVEADVVRDLNVKKA